MPLSKSHTYSSLAHVDIVLGFIKAISYLMVAAWVCSCSIKG